MRFLLDTEQREFGRTLDAMLTAADTPSSVRAWGAGDFGPGRALWSRLAEAGVFALAVPEEHEGVGPLPVELAVAFVELGRHAVPGPVVETVAVAALLDSLAAQGDPAPGKRFLPSLASGGAMATLAVDASYAVDADAAQLCVVGGEREIRLAPACGATHPSADPARRLARPEGGGELLARGEGAAVAARVAGEWAAFATAAQALGVGRALLAQTVEYVKQRTQFGTPIGSFQAVQHRLADTLVALEFAEPLLYGAALSMSGPDIAAAKAAAGEAAYQASRTALQLHGAIGYTEELDLSLWIRKAQALRTAWGTPAQCRARVLGAATPS
ncbi:acyl-CoA dehydrogenase family protein [Streptomyces monticola]|uniref:Acyl-CoA dehydrogenase family protein n=1 Tax=Streptomyces monticola TaxID=2666263 RepID=A0ABW2JKP0_9ACTN